MMSATWANPSVRSRCCGAFGEKRRERIDAFDPPLGEVVRALGAERNRAVLLGVDEQPADVWVLAQGRQQARMQRVDLLQREALPLLHQVDEPEVA